ncbi:hypothetical protein LZ32DRAFT_78784 [Colletotrichum eremochloae]|nr:hypothetical protein LZ32DRAFT_78784 [Colletotrichum eremochloae]
MRKAACLQMHQFFFFFLSCHIHQTRHVQISFVWPKTTRAIDQSSPMDIIVKKYPRLPCFSSMQFSYSTNAK